MSVASGVTLFGWVIAQRLLGVPSSFLQPTLGAAGALVAAGGWQLKHEDTPDRCGNPPTSHPHNGPVRGNG